MPETKMVPGVGTDFQAEADCRPLGIRKGQWVHVDDIRGVDTSDPMWFLRAGFGCAPVQDETPFWVGLETMRKLKSNAGRAPSGDKVWIANSEGELVWASDMAKHAGLSEQASTWDYISGKYPGATPIWHDELRVGDVLSILEPSAFFEAWKDERTITLREKKGDNWLVRHSSGGHAWLPEVTIRQACGLTRMAGFLMRRGEAEGDRLAVGAEDLAAEIRRLGQASEAAGEAASAAEREGTERLLEEVEEQLFQSTGYAIRYDNADLRIFKVPDGPHEVPGGYDVILKGFPIDDEIGNFTLILDSNEFVCVSSDWMPEGDRLQELKKRTVAWFHTPVPNSVGPFWVPTTAQVEYAAERGKQFQDSILAAMQRGKCKVAMAADWTSEELGSWIKYADDPGEYEPDEDPGESDA